MEQGEKLKVLYVDDEPNNLISFKAGFRFNYRIVTASSADDALEILEKEKDIIAIISDQRMPGKTGVELFEDIRYKHPEPVRILITGFTDIEDVVGAINKGNIFRYIRKPWIESDIISAIEEAHKYYMASSMLMKRNHELQTAYNSLDRFAYSVTHDLKGPIVSSKEALRLAQSTTDEQMRAELIDLTYKSLEKLDNFVDSIFDYYKLKQGELTISEINLQQLVKDQLDIHGMLLKIENIRFEHQVVQDIPFMCDEVKLRIIMYNLLANAFKYQRKDNADKYVRLDVEVKNGNAVITVSDNGIGIPEQYKEKIFDVFYRATTQQPGSGIGLFNVKDAILKLNGTIEVTSKENEGSTFKVTIPGKL